jgi:hypothetical protein
MRDRRCITNRGHPNASVIDRPDRRLATAARAFDAHFALLHAGLRGFLGRFVSGLLGGEWRTLTRTAKPARARRRLRYQVTLKISDRDHRVIERRRDVSDPDRDVLLLFLAKDLLFSSRGCFSHMKLLLARRLLLRNSRAPRAFACARIGMRALAAYGQSATMP